MVKGYALNGSSGEDWLDHSIVWTSSTVSAANATAVTVDLAAGTTAWDNGGAVSLTFSSIESAKGGSGNDRFTGNSASNRFEGGSGVDVADYSSLGASLDIQLLSANTANNGSATATGSGVGVDTFVGIEQIIGSQASNDSFTGFFAGYHLDGGGAGETGSDWAIYTASSVALTVDLQAGLATDGSGTQTLTGIENFASGSANDLFIGNASNNNFNGGTGLQDKASYSYATSALTIDLSLNFARGGAEVGSD